MYNYVQLSLQFDEQDFMQYSVYCFNDIAKCTSNIVTPYKISDGVPW